MIEQWIDIKGYEGLYQVGDLGNIKSFKNGKEKILACNPSANGYRNVQLWKDGKKQSLRVNRVVAKHWKSNPLNLAQVNHLNGDRLDDRAANLEWCSQSDNLKHLYKNGRNRIEDSQVLEVISDLLEGKTTGTISRLRNISYRTVHGIKNFERRLNIPRPYPLKGWEEFQ